MPEELDPKDFGLQSRTIIERINQNTIALVINRKSRIIMSDGRKILDKVEKINDNPDIDVALLLVNVPESLCANL